MHSLSMNVPVVPEKEYVFPELPACFFYPVHPTK